MTGGNRDSIIIAVGCGHGARDRGCADGPAALRRPAADAAIPWIDIAVTAPPGRSADMVVADVCDRLARRVESECRRGRFPVVIGGDHSIAVGTWTGMRRAPAGVTGFRLVWIDAHMDCHVPQTSPSSALHGMPVACLMGECHPRLTAAACPCPVFAPGCIRLVGVRSFEPEEVVLAARMGVAVTHMAEIERQGLARVLAEAAGDGPFGISLDLDAVDPLDAPGVGSPVEGGIRGDALLAALTPLLASPRCLGLEIAEYNPNHDIDRRTARLVEALIGAATATGAQP
ncbi:arginase [Magnetospirillum sp. SS-4]|uniref:arginase n=1 Tax=Magnetospirillum sp. SS-4 TaxID=2681465 RepID=UPI00137F8B94|nr:arginase [Magnetospirillum sp. SS-4]CAA7626388.1 Arginase [Magnetospirillum sp. SS-4]